jgi:hypothetical protein
MSRYFFGFLLALSGGALAKPDREKPSRILEKLIGDHTDSRPQKPGAEPDAGQLATRRFRRTFLLGRA